jgi:hypothetical protein
MTAANNLFFKPPFIGLLAFVGVFIVQGLGHTIMIVMEDLLGHQWMFQAAFGMGLVGLGMLLYGMTRPGETAATWWGFVAAMLLWTGWIEFTFIEYAHQMNVAPIMSPDGGIDIKPEYLVMEASVAVLLVTLLFFLLNKETKCNFFRWIQRNCHLPVGKPTQGYERNFALITFIESIYLLWFFYLVLMVLYNPHWVGATHPITYIYFVLNTIWAIYLFGRLIRMWKVATAVRYGIATAIIAFTSYEIIGHWGIGEDIWVQPWEYGLELSLITLAIAVIIGLSWFTPDHIKAKLNREAREREQEQSKRQPQASGV